MSDDRIEPRIMASTTIRPTIVTPTSMRPDGRSTELTPAVSTVDQVRAVVMGMTANAARTRLEALGFEVRVVSRDGKPDEEIGGANGECANLSVVEGKVADVALR
jgi:hypothetical protein